MKQERRLAPLGLLGRLLLIMRTVPEPSDRVGGRRGRGRRRGRDWALRLGLVRCDLRLALGTALGPLPLHGHLRHLGLDLLPRVFATCGSLQLGRGSCLGREGGDDVDLRAHVLGGILRPSRQFRLLARRWRDTSTFAC